MDFYHIMFVKVHQNRPIIVNNGKMDVKMGKTAEFCKKEWPKCGCELPKIAKKKIAKVRRLVDGEHPALTIIRW